MGRQQSDRDVFLEGPEAETIVRKISEEHRKQHLARRFLWSLWQPIPLFTMVDTGVWDDACRTRLKEFLGDAKAVDALTLMLFGGGYTQREEVAKILDLDEYLRLVERRLGATDMHQSVRAALEKAKDAFFW